MSVALRKAMPPVTALQLAVALLLFLIGSPLTAQEGVDRLFPAAPTGYLTDVAGVVDASSAARIEQVAKTLRERTGAELAVVTLPGVGQYEASDVALAIGRRWGVGAKADIGAPIRNAGMVILLVPKKQGQPGKIRLEVGQGLEGIITDAMAARVRDAMRPLLAQEQYGPGLLVGVEAVAARVADQLGVRDSVLTTTRPATGGGMSPIFPFLLVFVVIAVLMAMASARSNRSGIRRGHRRPNVYWGPGPWIGGGGWGGGGFGSGGGGGFGGFGGGGGFSGGGAGGDF